MHRLKQTVRLWGRPVKGLLLNLEQFPPEYFVILRKSSENFSGIFKNSVVIFDKISFEHNTWINNCLHLVSEAVFVIYLILLVWFILFKLQFFLADIEYGRSLILLPFNYDGDGGNQLQFKKARIIC